jgi:hypothetical protein
MMEVADPEVTLFSCEEQVMQLVHDSISTRKFPWCHTGMLSLTAFRLV